MVRMEPEEENTSENGQGGTRRKCILKWSEWNHKKQIHLKMVRVEREENIS